MDLDNLRDSTSNQAAPSAMANFDQFSGQFKGRFTLHLYLETAVAIFAFLMLLAALIFGEKWYPIVIQNIFPELAHAGLTFHPLMIFSMLVMMFYCIAIPLKLKLANSQKIALLTSSLKERIDAEIQHYEKLQKVFSSAHIWSLAPAAIIGVSFFWGLQVSLINTWMPSVYLLAYFAFVLLSFLGGLKLKSIVIKRDINPLLQTLYQSRRELTEL